MTTEDNQLKSEMYLGYFASAALALICAGMVAGYVADHLQFLIKGDAASDLRHNLSAALFMGITLANPVGVLLTKARLRPAFDHFGIGFVLGWLVQAVLITPYAGTAYSHFLLLILAVSGVPFALLKDQLDAHFLTRGTTTKEAFLAWVLKVLNWPQRFHYIAFMTASFLVFRTYANTMQTTLMALGAILLVATVIVVIGGWNTPDANDDSDDDFQTWLDLLPEDTASQSRWAAVVSRLRDLLCNVVPSAAFLGGMTWLAFDVVQGLYPDLGADLDSPKQIARTVAYVAVSGLAVVLFGALAAAGFGMMLLQLVARYRHWTQAQLRENCFRLLRNMYFRPIRRN